MRDEETGSWWQQISGEAILGPLKGKRLKSVMHDELTFSTWKREEPNGRVLKPDERIAAAGEYAPANWEERMSKVPVATLSEDTTLPQRELVVGLKVKDAARAYPLSALRKQNPIIDHVGGTPVIFLMGDDGRSVRAFETTVDGRHLELFLKTGVTPLRLIDSEGSEWDFTGTALSGPLAGRKLSKIYVLNEYWFDWKTYNPETTVYALGNR